MKGMLKTLGLLALVLGLVLVFSAGTWAADKVKVGVLYAITVDDGRETGQGRSGDP